MKAMILAAGKGERLRPLTLKTPKPLIKINGKPIIVRHIERLARIGIKKIVINHLSGETQYAQILGNGEKWGVKIIYSPESKALGTGGGIKNALPMLGFSPFIVISGDIVTDFPYSLLSKKMLTSKGHLILINNPDHHPKGDYCLENNKIYINNRANNSLTFASIALLAPSLFSHFKDYFSIHEVFVKAIYNQCLTGEHFSGYHCNVDNLQRLQLAELALKTGKVKENEI